MGEVRMDLYLKTQRWLYHRGNREVKKRILDEFCKTHGYHRKAAARLLRQLPIPDKKTKKQVKRKLMTRTYYWSCLKRFGLPGIRFVAHCGVNSKGSGTLIGL
ncbi:hypothetical protein SCZ71_04230 [Legionella pneumophila serogroup 1]|uniref:Integrase n=1 Tax=Legionella pneumophila TaxID=446 RepID=A0A378K1P8_LEGPN|nr:hypothetical protein [Legionella pneumophila]ABQ54069.1 hypothetical protein LPC_0069 [Legionella pneumophila str. Corby]ADG23310.1 hypothetical protein lpa_00086 [Legionella pneumophila 2300/99 Alcoy]MCK1870726.1 hypothetical protein [Legionella pneumophila]MCO1452516.1 hypothetical protein [Legionella pneumophila]MCW8401005.1 hypothetical protein [Legionella pneumophila]